MYMEQKNLGITDYAVSRAIMELQDQHDVINADMIAEHINGERTAVYRSMRKLKQAKFLVRGDGSPRAGGYQYEYTGP